MKTKASIACHMYLAVFLSAGFFISCSPPQAQKVTPTDMSITRPGATSLVVVQSRTGNTARLGLYISEKMNADYIRLETPDGYGDSYLSYTSRKNEVPVKPLKVDFIKYKLVFLGSPIWYYHPTAFIYTFLRNNDLSGKKVVLFYTNQGGLGESSISEWKAAVQKQGGMVVDVIGIDRSGLKTDEEFPTKIKALVESHSPGWR